MPLLYNFAIFFYYQAIRIASLFNPKAKLWIKGRKDIFKQIETSIGSEDKISWFHCASLGEFEQGRPIIEAFRKQFPGYKILLTFFSPSGYEIRKNYAGADFIFYLPIDNPANARRFIKLVHPSIAIFIKYEFWYNYLTQLKKNNIPVLVVSAIFRPEQHFFAWYGGWFRKMLKNITHIFVQNKVSMALLNSAGIENVSISGDTRFDRVASIAGNAKQFPLIETFAGNDKLFLAGSTWPADESLLISLIDQHLPGLKFIIAPHETDKDRINQLLSRLNAPALCYSQANEKTISDYQVLIIDSIGILSHLYRYATLAYIGGAFGKGLHNILEAATFGNPVLFGTNYQKFKEAVDLIQRKGVFSITNADELIYKTRELLSDKNYHDKCSEICRNYVIQNQGATGIILAKIKNYLYK